MSVEQVQISAAGMPGEVERMATILEDAVLDTTEAYGLTDPRTAAALVAAAWADILREEPAGDRADRLPTGRAQGSVHLRDPWRSRADPFRFSLLT